MSVMCGNKLSNKVCVDVIQFIVIAYTVIDPGACVVYVIMSK